MAKDLYLDTAIDHAMMKGSQPRHAIDLPHHVEASERIIRGVLALFEGIQSLQSLEPSAASSRLFNQMFDLVTTSKTTSEDEKKVLRDPRVISILPEIWKTWGAAEYCLEKNFAQSVIGGHSSATCLKIYNTFPYLDQYRQLARMETNTIDTALGELGLPLIRKIACIGSGPTPFTSLCLQERYGRDVEIVNIDRDADAVRISSKVVEKCNIPNIAFLQTEAALLTDLGDFDLVHLAAMVGESAEVKTGLLIKVAACMRPGALMLLRSTDGLRQLLYPAFAADDRRVLDVVTPVVATRYFGSSTSLTAIVVQVDAPRKP